ncbi:UNVERIFIED_CONTAM: hypothetical protein Sradi_2932200 [Sesamum radiatum]|uniref:Uncharacterized protein n=1 Tax=Sesamum radiatum TaxID=300843 RepID=A0AAW2RYZ8_SESRA
MPPPYKPVQVFYQLLLERWIHCQRVESGWMVKIDRSPRPPTSIHFTVVTECMDSYHLSSLPLWPLISPAQTADLRCFKNLVVGETIRFIYDNAHSGREISHQESKFDMIFSWSPFGTS